VNILWIIRSWSQELVASVCNCGRFWHGGPWPGLLFPGQCLRWRGIGGAPLRKYPPAKPYCHQRGNARLWGFGKNNHFVKTYSEKRRSQDVDLANLSLGILIVARWGPCEASESSSGINCLPRYFRRAPTRKTRNAIAINRVPPDLRHHPYTPTPPVDHRDVRSPTADQHYSPQAAVAIANLQFTG